VKNNYVCATFPFCNSDYSFPYLPVKYTSYSTNLGAQLGYTNRQKGAARHTRVNQREKNTMERLDQIGTIRSNLKTSSKKAIKALHKLIFEQEGDRGNRKRLREFQGFPFAIDSDEYKVKIAYAEANLSWADLVAVCNVLAIEYAGTKRELTQRI